MGSICVSKQNRHFDEDCEYQTVHLNSLNNDSFSSTASSSMSFAHHTHNRKINDSNRITTAYIFQIVSTHNLPSIEETVSNIVTELCTVYCGSLYTCHNPLIIQSGTTLKLNDKNPLKFDSILLRKNSTLTINRWNSKQKNGGVLDLEVFGDIVMEMGSKMTVTGRGYTGGDYGRNGESFSDKSQNIDSKQSKTRKPNNGGGGGAQISIFGEFGAQSSCGGGGAYATQGKDGLIESQERNECIKYGIGGVTYGSAALTHLHLGSGGGCGYHFDEERNTLRANKGGSGGGAIRIQCHGSIQMRQDSKICANGTKGKGVMSGCGAGGSIHLLLGKRLSMDGSAKIEAMGGVNSTVKAGNGGEGRICIQFSEFDSDKNNDENMSLHNITPQPYIG